MKNYYCIIKQTILLFTFLLPFHIFSQVIPTANNNAMQLVQQMVGNGVTILSANLTCPAGASGTYTTSGVCSSVGIPQGVLLTSGSVNNVPGPNNSPSTGTDNFAPGNALLDALTGNTTYDACVLTFSFIPTTNSISFNFMFGSEEYPEFVSSSVNDGFGFFLTGPPSYSNTNIAYIPSTSTPITIDNVNATTNSAYYNDNTGGNCLQYDGYTDVITAQANVTPCATYTMTMAIGDAGDGIYDSGVMIEANSFSSGTFDATLVSQTNATCSTLGSATVTASGGTPPYSYSWNTSPPQNTPTATNLAPGNYYCVVSYNVCSVVVSDTVFATINGVGTVNAPITAQTNVICNGGNNGSATVTPNGGVAPYTYSWSPSGGTGTTASGLTAGTYTVLVTDNAGCTITSTVSITEPPVLTANITATTNPNCGGNNGTATVTAGGGTAGYTYNWTPLGGTGATGTGLSAGTYTVTVTDANGCVQSTTTSLVSASGPTANITSTTNVTCFGGNNGSATVTPFGGTPPYSYSWSPSGGTGGTAASLTAGTYTVTVTDNTGCTVTASTTITQPPQIIANISATTNVTCFGGNDGSSTVTVGGGIPGYTYSWTPSGGTGATGTTLSNGTYTVTVTDNNGCTTSTTSNITQPTQVSANISATVDPTCGLNNGSITVTAGGGTPGYTYSWAPSGGTGASASALGAGTYTVTVTDANGCTQTATQSLVNSSTLTANISASTNVTCFGGNDGSATVTAGGGSPGYTYSWSPTGGTGATATGFTVGTYTVVVTDANLCSISTTVVITEPPLLFANTSVSSDYNGQDVSCNGSTDGSASVLAGGGTPGYTYSWSTTPVQNTQSASSLGAGSYTVTITDNNGCTVSATVTLSEPTLLNSVASITSNYNGEDVSCFGSTDGAADVISIGGTPGYMFSWSTVPVQNTQSISNIGAATYTVTVTDANGCTSTSSVTLNEPTQVVINITSQTDVSCFGYNDGSVVLNGNGGTGIINYIWNPGGPGTSSSNTLAPGNYDVTATDANGCTSSVSFVINEPAGIIISVTPDDDSICVNDVVILDAVVIGGNGGYVYNWNGNPGSATLNDNPVVTTIYTVVVTDANGCTLSSTSIVNVGDIPNPSFTVTNVCVGDQTMFNNTSNVGNGTIIENSWDFGDGSPLNYTANPTYLYGSSGQYNVTLTTTTDFGCMNSTVVPVNVFPNPVPNFTADNLSGCSPVCVNFSDLTNTGGGIINSWEWQSMGQSFSNGQNPYYCFTAPGSYDITLNVETTDGCSGSLNLANYIQVYPDPIADFNMNGNQFLESQAVIHLTDASFNASSWYWDFGDGNSSTAQNPTHNYSDTGSFCIKLTVTSSQGCTDDIFYCITVLPEYYIYVPNTFTPNDDKVNDVFMIYGRGISEATLLIFDRWGESIARLDYDQPYTIGWDGKYNGELVKQDVYSYKLYIKDAFGDTHDYIGHVNVIY